MFSRRTTWPPRPDPVARALDRRRATGAPVWDLSRTNPTTAGLLHPEAVYRTLGDPRASTYDPAPLGLPSARAAVAKYYRARGLEVAPERIWLYASTSDAYAQLFALLCDRGATVAVPRPGYPLLDVLADVADVERVGYPRRFDGERWAVDLERLDAIEARVIVAVSPDNPTGSVLTPVELDHLRRLAAGRDAALLLDAVFADYPLCADDAPLGALHAQGGDLGLTFVLSGLSKVAALPQLKLSWVVVDGPSPLVAEATRRAELIADAFLSVSTPVQRALPELLRAAEPMQARIRARLRRNLAALRAAVAGAPLDLLPVEAGWTALLRLPALPGFDDEAWATAIVEDAGVLVTPGHLFDLDPPPKLSVSLLGPSDEFAEGIAKLVDFVNSRC